MIGLSRHSRNYGPGTPDEIFAFIKRLGYEYIDVDSVGTIRQDDVIENPKKQAQLVQELTAKYDLRLAEYFLGTVAVDGISVNNSQPDTVLRGKMLDNFARICDYAQMAGFRSIMGSAGALHKELGYERSFDNAANTLREMVAMAYRAWHFLSCRAQPSLAAERTLPSYVNGTNRRRLKIYTGLSAFSGERL